MFGNLLKKINNFADKTVSGVKQIVTQDAFCGTEFSFGGTTIQPTKQIAQGSFAFVYETNNPEFVIKRMIVQQKSQLAEALDEIHYQSQLNHCPNICKVFACFLSSQMISMDTKLSDLKQVSYPVDFSIIIERCESSALSVLNKCKGFLPEKDILELFAGAVAGFTAQHNLQIINRDGKIENMLLKHAANPFHAENVRICDFGSCTQK